MIVVEKKVVYLINHVDIFLGYGLGSIGNSAIDNAIAINIIVVETN